MKDRTVQVRSYTRTVSPIPVEFICQRCQQPQIYTMYPGPHPKWCSACFFPEVRKQQVREHKRRQRAKPPRVSDGSPKLS
jgi:hypothetical protein